jgi:hypothetical protein
MFSRVSLVLAIGVGRRYEPNRVLGFPVPGSLRAGVTRSRTARANVRQTAPATRGRSRAKGVRTWLPAAILSRSGSWAFRSTSSARRRRPGVVSDAFPAHMQTPGAPGADLRTKR